MKRTVLGLLAAALMAQTPTRTVSLAWEDAVNPTGTTYTVERTQGACSTTATFTEVASGVAAKTYDDVGVTPGRWCYQVRAVYDGLASVPSNMAPAGVKPHAPGNVTVVVR